MYKACRIQERRARVNVEISSLSVVVFGNCEDLKRTRAKLPNMVLWQDYGSGSWHVNSHFANKNKIDAIHCMGCESYRKEKITISYHQFSILPTIRHCQPMDTKPKTVEFREDLMREDSLLTLLSFILGTTAVVFFVTVKFSLWANPKLTRTNLAVICWYTFQFGTNSFNEGVYFLHPTCPGGYRGWLDTDFVMFLVASVLGLEPCQHSNAMEPLRTSLGRIWQRRFALFELRCLHYHRRNLFRSMSAASKLGSSWLLAS